MRIFLAGKMAGRRHLLSFTFLELVAVQDYLASWNQIDHRLVVGSLAPLLLNLLYLISIVDLGDRTRA